MVGALTNSLEPTSLSCNFSGMSKINLDVGHFDALRSFSHSLGSSWAVFVVYQHALCCWWTYIIRFGLRISFNWYLHTCHASAQQTAVRWLVFLISVVSGMNALAIWCTFWHWCPYLVHYPKVYCMCIIKKKKVNCWFCVFLELPLNISWAKLSWYVYHINVHLNIAYSTI